MSAYPSAKALWVVLKREKKAHDFKGCLFFKGGGGGGVVMGYFAFCLFLFTLEKKNIKEKCL